LRIHRGCVLTACVKGEDTLGGRVIPDGIRASADFDLVQRLQSLEIENADRILAAVARESLADLGHERHAMDAGSVADFADRFPGICVNHHDPGSARNVQATLVRIDLQIVPATLPAQGPGVYEVIRGRGGG
jgi:hypothetical protein